MYPCPGIDPGTTCPHRYVVPRYVAPPGTAPIVQCDKSAGHDGPHVAIGLPRNYCWPAGTRRVVGSSAWARKYLTPAAAITSSRVRREREG